MSADSTIHSYNRRAEEYEERWNSYLRHTHKVFLKHIQLNEQDSILDVSGGTGLLARMIIDQGFLFNHLVVNDPSEKMLGLARKRLSGESGVSFTSNKAEALSFEGRTFDKIFCLNSFHFYSDQRKVLQDLFTLLRPGGRLYLLDWNREGWFKIINRLIQWSSSEHIDTRSLPELEDMMQSCGFTTNMTKRWQWRYWGFLFINGSRTGLNQMGR